ncbi:hypothetical protein QBC34DRAFT_392986 [Podospora aff. communis PSN243]|uniref:Uncharacterized protein n=1 Tax=Podospora aff. communis PSN243 TaxID=3040156 RepID=A0AAV9H2T1_9PEZI|nr:hypothetical protein QBC34DRAFT_392986 [Podospora aff. communis PSN243]
MTTFAFGRLRMFKGEFHGAKIMFGKARKLWTDGSKSENSYFVGACVYRLGCCYLDQPVPNAETAAKHLREALDITSLHRKHMPAEHARCLCRLAEALGFPGSETGNPLWQEGKDKADEARKIYSEQLCGWLPHNYPAASYYDRWVCIDWR